MMKTTKFIVRESFSNGTSNELGTFDNISEARSFFNDQLKEDGFKPSEMESWEIELEKFIIDEDGNAEDSDSIEFQTLYSEGTMDRKNYKGDYPINYWFECIWNADKKDLEYTFYFHGEKEEDTVLESHLFSWFF